VAWGHVWWLRCERWGHTHEDEEEKDKTEWRATRPLKQLRIGRCFTVKQLDYQHLLSGLEKPFKKETPLDDDDTALGVTAGERPDTIHDFFGFPQALFDVQYPAPGSAGLTERTAQILARHYPIIDHKRGLDHGAIRGARRR
jgi:hypothetical protein